MIRRALGLIVALCLTIGCGLLLAFLLFFARGFYVWMLVSSSIGLFIGLYWLWADYINADPRPEN